jgi:hypothetical protein
MRDKLFLKNIIENHSSMNKLSRDALLKIINLIPSYLDKNIIELVDEKIEALNNQYLIEISNIKINDIKSELSKSKHNKISKFQFFKIYEYDEYVDVYFTDKSVNSSTLLEELIKHVSLFNFTIVSLSSRTIRTPHNFYIKDYNNGSL